jgi:hypothetical protein
MPWATGVACIGFTSSLYQYETTGILFEKGFRCSISPVSPRFNRHRGGRGGENPSLVTRSCIPHGRSVVDNHRVQDGRSLTANVVRGHTRSIRDGPVETQTQKSWDFAYSGRQGRHSPCGPWQGYVGPSGVSHLQGCVSEPQLGPRPLFLTSLSTPLQRHRDRRPQPRHVTA